MALTVGPWTHAQMTKGGNTVTRESLDWL
ncbi:MAG: hypothetical protein JWR37_4638, partial [Mycobacterium sp.]|nr:hypothetical protein [Mycobacterium sp.]